MKINSELAILESDTEMYTTVVPRQ